MPKQDSRKQRENVVDKRSPDQELRDSDLEDAAGGVRDLAFSDIIVSSVTAPGGPRKPPGRES